MTQAKDTYRYYDPAGQGEGVLPVVENLRVLEIGFGSGSLLKELHKNGNDVYGTDAGKKIVDKAKSDGFENVFLLDVSEQPLPFEDDFFDAVYCYEVFEHLTNPHRLFFEIRRVLKPKHLLYFSVPTQKDTMGYGPGRHSFVYPGLLERKHIERFFMQMYFKIEYYRENQVNIVHHRNYILKNMKQKGLPDIMDVILRNYSVTDLYGNLLSPEDLHREIEREVEPYVQILDYFARQNKWKGFKKVMSELFEMYPDHLPMYLKMAETLFKYQKYDEARSCLERLKEFPDLPDDVSDQISRLLLTFSK